MDFVAVEFFLGAIVCPPPHPFRLRRKVPFVRIKATNRAQPRFYPRLPLVRPIIAVEELRVVGDLPPPSLPTREITSTRRLPEHRHSAVHVRADEIPLPTAEMARTSHQIYALIEAADLDVEPSFVRAVMSAVRSPKQSVRLCNIRPANPAAFVTAWINKPSPGKSVYIELEPVSQPNSVTWSWHRCSLRLFSRLAHYGGLRMRFNCQPHTPLVNYMCRNPRHRRAPRKACDSLK